MSDNITQYQFLDPLIETEDTLLKIRAAAIKLYMEGKTIMEYGNEGTSATRQFVANVEDILAETRMALKQKNPAKYGYPIRSSRQFRVA